MARQDIHADPGTGELSVTDNLTNKALFSLCFPQGVTGTDVEAVCAEITLPSGYDKRLSGQGVWVMIPYCAVYQRLQIRFSIGNENVPEYFLNPETNKPWFTVYWEKAGKVVPVVLSELYAINRKGVFHLKMVDGSFLLYSGNETDLVIKASLNQNQAFLLKALPGNMYQYPTTGVGLIEYLHGNFENSGLAARLQEEFENDRMVIHNAYMDSVTGELLLEVEERNG